METEQNKGGFTYNYSAREQNEIKKIRNKYSEPEEDGIERLRRLDRSASKKATSRSIALGCIGALIMGIGMSMAMTDIASFVGLSQMQSMLVGIPVGVLGIILVALAYPVYQKTLKKERDRIAPEIIRLSDELLK